MARARKKKKSLFIRFAVLSFIAVITFLLVDMQIEVNSKKRELEQLKSDIAAQELENAESQRLLDMGDDAEYVERAARDKLGYAYPDEKVFVDRSAN